MDLLLLMLLFVVNFCCWFEGCEYDLLWWCVECVFILLFIVLILVVVIWWVGCVICDCGIWLWLVIWWFICCLLICGVFDVEVYKDVNICMVYICFLKLWLCCVCFVCINFCLICVIKVFLFNIYVLFLY